jgi:co-chaperonin GroES (HSP10)
MKKKQVQTKRHSRKKVEEGILLYLKGGKVNSDMEFGETEVRFQDRVLFDKYAKTFKDFLLDGVRYIQASSDEKKMTITYLFH